MRTWQLADVLGVRENHVRRWLIRLDRWPWTGNGSRVALTSGDVRAAVVAIAVAGPGVEARAGTTARALHAGRCAGDRLDARYIVATPTGATGHPTAEAAVETWVEAGRPVAAVVCVDELVAPILEPAR